MNKQVVHNAIQFLNRVNLQGHEALAFHEVMLALHAELNAEPQTSTVLEGE